MGWRIAIGASSFAAEDDEPARLLREAGCEIAPNPHGRRMNEAEIIAQLKDVDGLIAGLEPLNRRVLESAGRLRAVARVGVGMDNVDAEAARELGIAVSNTPGAPVRAVAEATLAAMLALARRLPAMNAELHAGRWTKMIAGGLDGARLLIVGYGRIGRRVAELARPFGARILVCDPAVQPEALQPGDSLVSLEEGLAEADIITLHAGGSATILGPAQFAAMREGVLLLNSARGELADEAALVAALESGRVAGAWFDAFWSEPYTGPLTQFAQVLLTPHAATYTRPCRRAMETGAVLNLLRDLGDAP